MRFLFAAALLASFAMCLPGNDQADAVAQKCTGKDPCPACHNCTKCAYCKDGKTCGACKPKKTMLAAATCKQ
jgi:hypothetical protein